MLLPIREKIIQKNIINYIEFSQINPEQKNLYTVYETERVQDGIQSYHNAPISFIKKSIKAMQNQEEMQRLFQNQSRITLRNIIASENYKKLNPEQKNLYTVYKTKRVQDGMQSYNNVTQSYIKKSVKEMQNQEEMQRLVQNQSRITLHNIIASENYKKLNPEQKNLYTVYETERVQDGMQSYHNVTRSYIKKSVKSM